MSDIHKIASQFLKDYANSRPTYVAEPVDIAEPAETPGLVVLRRASNPPYFYGFKPSGRPIFTHDHKIAKVFNSGCATIGQHIERLSMIGEEVEQHLTIWKEGRVAQ